NTRVRTLRANGGCPRGLPLGAVKQWVPIVVLVVGRHRAGTLGGYPGKSLLTSVPRPASAASPTQATRRAIPRVRTGQAFRSRRARPTQTAKPFSRNGPSLDGPGGDRTYIRTASGQGPVSGPAPVQHEVAQTAQSAHAAPHNDAEPARWQGPKWAHLGSNSARPKLRLTGEFGRKR